MSRLASQWCRGLTPYTPGEQPRGGVLVKLNTNECPYPPSRAVTAAIKALPGSALRLYPDPGAGELKRAAAAAMGLDAENVFAAAGSDQALTLAMMAFCARGGAVWYPDITYGFYKVTADMMGLKSVRPPLDESFGLNIADYLDATGPVIIANPNAPTGLMIPVADIVRLLESDRDRLVIIDEAYVDFSGQETCARLVNDYDNLLVVHTFSKSRALAGMRLGFAYGDAALIEDIERVKGAFDPYNLSIVAVKAGVAAFGDAAYLRETARMIAATRARSEDELRRRGFAVVPSSANFIFAAHPKMDGASLAAALRKKGVLVRQFGGARTGAYIRISVGLDSEMAALMAALDGILEGKA